MPTLPMIYGSFISFLLYPRRIYVHPRVWIIGSAGYFRWMILSTANWKLWDCWNITTSSSMISSVHAAVKCSKMLVSIPARLPMYDLLQIYMGQLRVRKCYIRVRMRSTVSVILRTIDVVYSLHGIMS